MSSNGYFKLCRAYLCRLFFMTGCFALVLAASQFVFGLAPKITDASRFNAVKTLEYVCGKWDEILKADPETVSQDAVDLLFHGGTDYKKPYQILLAVLKEMPLQAGALKEHRLHELAFAAVFVYERMLEFESREIGLIVASETLRIAAAREYSAREIMHLWSLLESLKIDVEGVLIELRDFEYLQRYRVEPAIRQVETWLDKGIEIDVLDKDRNSSLQALSAKAVYFVRTASKLPPVPNPPKRRTYMHFLSRFHLNDSYVGLDSAQLIDIDLYSRVNSILRACSKALGTHIRVLEPHSAKKLRHTLFPPIVFGLEPESQRFLGEVPQALSAAVWKGLGHLPAGWFSHTRSFDVWTHEKILKMLLLHTLLDIEVSQDTLQHTLRMVEKIEKAVSGTDEVSKPARAAAIIRMFQSARASGLNVEQIPRIADMCDESIIAEWEKETDQLIRSGKIMNALGLVFCLGSLEDMPDLTEDDFTGFWNNGIDLGPRPENNVCLNEAQRRFFFIMLQMGWPDNYPVGWSIPATSAFEKAEALIVSGKDGGYSLSADASEVSRGFPFAAAQEPLKMPLKGAQNSCGQIRAARLTYIQDQLYKPVWWTTANLQAPKAGF